MPSKIDNSQADPESGLVRFSPRGGTASPGRARLRLRRPALAVAALSLVAAACGGAATTKTGSSTGSSSNGSSAAAGSSGSTAGSGAGGGSGGAGSFGSGSFPGATGTVAAISGSTLEVQNPETGQVSVLVTSSTAISRTVDVPASSVRTGTCVTVVGTGSSTSAIAARTVSIRAATNGSCAIARRGFSGTPGHGSFPGAGTAPSRAGKRHPTFGSKEGFASGKVTATTSGGFTVLSTFGKTTKTVKVATTTATTYTEVEKGTLSDVHVGSCASAFGSTSQTGAVTAKTLSLRQPGPKGCTAGFGAAGGFGGFGGGVGGGSAAGGGSGSGGQGTTNA